MKDRIFRNIIQNNMTEQRENITVISINAMVLIHLLKKFRFTNKTNSTL